MKKKTKKQKALSTKKAPLFYVVGGVVFIVQANKALSYRWLA